MDILSSSLHHPTKSLKLCYCYPHRRATSSQGNILMPGFVSKRRFLGSLKVTDQRSMVELARMDGVEGEVEAAFSHGSPSSGRVLQWVEYESVLNSMSKWLVASLFGVFILWKHDAEAMWAATGSVVNSWLSYALKQMLNHQRPVSAMRSDPGMPSSHAQSIFYIAVLGVLSLFNWMGINFFTVIFGTFALACGSYLTWLRVSQRLHTVNQVLVGAMLGTICAISWFQLWHAYVLQAFSSNIWVQVFVVLGSVTFFVTFVAYVIWHWLMVILERAWKHKGKHNLCLPKTYITFLINL